MDRAFSAKLKKIDGLGLSLAGFFILALPLAAAAQNELTDDQEYETKINRAQKITAVDGGGGFGESISLFDGKTSFYVEDVSVPGNSSLKVSVGRTFNVESSNRGLGSEIKSLGGFSDWDIDIPYISGVFWSSSGWVAESSGILTQSRCSVNNIPMIVGGHPYALVGSGVDIHWSSQKVDKLLKPSSNLSVPSSGGPFPWISKNRAVFSCLSSTKNGYPGEGFIGHTTDGGKYYFDWGVEQAYPTLKYSDGASRLVGRKKVYLLASKVVDRFGNWVNYTYDGIKLKRIESSDGRSIELAYGGDGNIQSVSANGRVWQYTYVANGSSDGGLAQVALPDGSKWEYRKTGKLRSRPPTRHMDEDVCATGLAPNQPFSYSIIAPFGAIGKFDFSEVAISRVSNPSNCEGPQPSYYGSWVLGTRQITGPGLSPLVTSYTIGAQPSAEHQKWSSQKNADGTVIDFLFGTNPASNENDLLQVVYKSEAGAQLRSEINAYAEGSSSTPYPSRIGNSPNTMDGNVIGRLAPLQQKVIQEPGVSFSMSVETFDGYARPLKTRKYSPWYSRTDVAEYYDDQSLWVLDQNSKITNGDTGLVEAQVEYNATAALPTKSYAFGKLMQTIAYNADGTLAAVIDGKNSTTMFSNWKRGVPQLIRFADNTSISANVNDHGWITAVTDENTYATSYGYDPMGRMVSVAYPGGDSVAWNTTTQTFEQVATVEYGLPAGHWRQTVATGNARKVTYFDALWRPVVTYEFDAGNQDASRRYQRFSYDYAGRTTFSSYPGYTDVLSTGIWSNYDALGRKTSVSQDSELGTLTTLTEYLPGNQTRVTNPRGNKTLTGYQVFDQPAYDAPVWIQHPEGATTEITRDVFGKPMSIRRRDASGGVSLTRSYVYDGYQQLCKAIEPETGASASGYDAAGNIVWTASGLSQASTTACDADAAFASGRRVDRSYDARNRITALTFPDGNGNQRWTYWPDGQVKQITTVNNGISTYNSFAYNKRRLLVGESQGQADGETWAIGYGYNANGHLTAHRYPSGQTIDYAPNALGQPTQAGSYATGVSYYPNGAIKQFTYGNGIVHTLTQNARQLADTSQDAYGGTAFLSDGYDYDANGNVAAISDGATGRNQRGNRTMSYDGLDRLTSAVSPMFGTATYGYDVLDNLIHVVAPGRDHYYCYDSYWQLTNVKTGNCSGSTVIGMSYDIQGNLKNKNGQGFLFDYGNRLREATGKETYRYDGYGRRTLATQGAGTIGSMYDQAGALRYQKNQRQAKATDYIMLGGSLVAEADWPYGQAMAVKDYVSWTAVGGATRYVVEESVDGVTWTSVYEGADPTWTSLARPSGTYSYRVLACMPDGTCSQAANVAHAQRPAFDIVPLLYQLLLN